MTRVYAIAILAVMLLGGLSAVAFEPKQDSTVGASSELRKENKKESSDKKNNSDKKDTNKDKKKGTKNRPQVPGFTKEREAAALTFVRAHHAELVELLEQLKAANTTEYQRAIRDLFLSSERLAGIEERNPQRYELELQDWKLNSRIQVLMARLTMRSDAVLEEELRQALAEQLDVREQLLLLDHERAVNRLAEVDEKLQELRRDRPGQVEKRLQELIEKTRTSPVEPSSQPTQK